MVKARLLYAAAAVIVIALGLGSRKLTDFLPLFVSINAGDALWASMIYLVFRAVWISYSRRWAAGAGLIFCCAIECSQLYQAEWINSIRSTLLGALFLEKDFYLSIWSGIRRVLRYLLLRMVGFSGSPEHDDRVAETNKRRWHKPSPWSTIIFSLQEKRRFDFEVPFGFFQHQQLLSVYSDPQDLCLHL